MEKLIEIINAFLSEAKLMEQKEKFIVYASSEFRTKISYYSLLKLTNMNFSTKFSCIWKCKASPIYNFIVNFDHEKEFANLTRETKRFAINAFIQRNEENKLS